MTKTAIIDIDGTVADLTHRLHHIKGPSRNYDAFYASVGDDQPIWPVLNVVQSLAQDHTIVFCSGRPETARADTIAWFERHSIPIEDHRLYMRPAGDFRDDFIIKGELLDQILAAGYHPVVVIDDRPSVVAMWRERGLLCLQCRDWDEAPKFKQGVLSLMVGPSGAGKSTLALQSFSPSQIISSDQIRYELTGDHRDQSHNDQVFHAVHAIAKARIQSGLDTVIDATNLRRKDRLACVALAGTHGDVEYIVVNRPLEEKLRDRDWRSEELIRKHDQMFKSQLKDILAGDGFPNVTVEDFS